jgi:NIPSNAP protein
MKRLVEIRSYKLQPGSAQAFHDTVVSAALPLLEAAGMEVVAFGPSPHEADTYFLVRAFDDLAQRNAQEDAFYGSPAWRQGPREAIVSRIHSMLDTLLWLSPESIADLRRSNVH